MEKYNLPNEAKKQFLKKTSHDSYFDWHLWADSLTEEEKTILEAEVLSIELLSHLSGYARQYYRFVSNHTEDQRLRELEKEFIEAQIDNRPQEEVDEIEQKHFSYTKSIIKK
ncbi:MAG: hypothetical protein ABIH42_03495 [Planctomycetota bacterium]